MFGLELIAAGMMYLAPTPVLGSIECHAKTPPSVHVTPRKSRVKYNFTKSVAELNHVDVDTVSPYGAQHNTSVGGLMSGSIQLKSNVSFMTETYQPFGSGCIFLKSVDVTIHVDPTIYVANEFPQDGCMHNVILAHEFKHIEADQLIVNKYTNIIGKALSDLIDAHGSTYGPMKAVRMTEIQNEIKEDFHDVVRKMNDEMTEERRIRQQAIDNVEEYKSIGGRCKSIGKRGRR